MLGELLGLILSIPTIIACLLVVNKWRPEINRILKIERGLKSHEVLAVAIFIGFTGQALDVAYWSAYWVTHFLDLSIAPFLQSLGGTVNVVFRYTMTIISAFLHLKAAKMYLSENQPDLVMEHRVLRVTLIVGAFFAILLVFIRLAF